MRSLCIALVCFAGCSKSGSLVFVTVDSVAPIADAARMHVTLADGQTHTSDLTLSPATFPPAHSFAVDVAAGVGGSMSVQVDVFDSAGTEVGSAAGSVPLVAGGRADLALTLGAGGGQDLSAAGGDMLGADLAGTAPPDLAWRTLAWTPKQISSAQMLALWASDATHIWVCGNSTANCFFSAGDDNWPQKSANPFYTPGGIWGTSATVLFFVGNNGDIRSWDNAAMTWTQSTSTVSTGMYLTAIWGSSINDVYVTANGGTGGPGEFIYHNTTGNLASGWTNPLAIGSGGLNGVSGTAGHTYAVGDGGRIFHSSDGSTWNALTTGVPSVNLHGVFVLDAQHVYVVGDSGTILFSAGNGMFTKQTIAATYATFAFRAVWAADADNVFAVGDTGAVLHGDAAGTWTAETSGLEVQTVNINAVWGTSATDVYVAADGGWVSHGK